MDATLSEEEILKRAERIAADVIFPKSKHHDATGEFPIENVRALGKAGLFGLLVPVAYGGLGAGIETFLKVVECIARACSSTAMIYVMHHTQYIMVVTHGTDQQKDFFLPPIARGESLFASGTTEPETGGIGDFCASAKQEDGDVIELSAKKPVVTSAAHANWVVVTTRSSPEAAGNMLTMVAVPGLAGNGGRDDLRPFGVWDCVGMRATGSSGLELVKTRVPRWYQIGPDDSRLMRLTTMKAIALSGYSAVWVGIAQAALDATVAHLTRRTHRFITNEQRVGQQPTVKPTDVQQQTLAEYATVQRQVAEMRVKIASARALLLATGRLMDEHFAQDVPALNEALLGTRVACGETAVDVCRIALRVSGVTGMRPGTLPLERHMRDALTAQVMAISEDLAKQLLGKRTLGLPV